MKSMFTPAEKDALRAAAREYIESAYRNYRSGGALREPSITACEVYDYLRQHGAGMEAFMCMPTRSCRTAVRNMLEGMRKRGEISSSIGMGGGIETRLYEPSPNAVAA